MSSTEQLDSLPFTVISVKTVNDAKSGAEVVAVSCARVRAGQISETLHMLLNPGTPLSEEFTRRTGLYSQTLQNQPALDEVLPEIASFVGRDIIIWANSPQKSNAVYRHFRLTQPKDRQFHLQTLAEKAIPNLPKHTLPALADAFGLEEAGLNRPETAAILSAKLLQKLLDILEKRHDIQTLPALLAFCPAIRHLQRRTRNHLAFDRDKLKHYPTQPGVYFMKNRLGEILYIGKAKNLRNRLRSYFQKQSRLPAKIAAMMKQVAIIDTIVVGSELEALLLESRLIKQHLPFFNKKIKDFQRMVFMKVSLQEEAPQISASHDTDDPGAAYFGPFAGKSILRYKLEVLNRVFKLRDCNDRKFAEHRQSPCMQYHLGLCSGPCAGLISGQDYRDSVSDFLRYLEQKPSNTIDHLVAKRDAYTEALKFEKAAAIQEHLELLERLQLKSYELLKAIEEHHCLIVLPDANAEQFRILSVLQGQPFQWHTYNPKLNDEGDLTQMIKEAFRQMDLLENASQRGHIAKSLFEEARLISAWLDNRTDDDGFVIYLKHKSRQQVLSELMLTLSARPYALADFTEFAAEEEAWEWEQNLEAES